MNTTEQNLTKRIHIISIFMGLTAGLGSFLLAFPIAAMLIGLHEAEGSVLLTPTTPIFAYGSIALGALLISAVTYSLTTIIYTLGVSLGVSMGTIE